MKRSTFLRTSVYSLLGLSVLPHLSFRALQDSYSLSQLIGKGNPDIVGDSYTTKMHRETAVAFQKMKTAAAQHSIDIELVSSYRSFQRQKEIFEGKFQRFTAQGLAPEAAIEKIIEYSTIPGTSRHHWGTDIDIIDRSASRPDSVLQPQHFHGEGPFCKLKEWLDENSESFGFFEVYTDALNRKGFKYEPWHFSYAPVSIPMLKEYRNLDIKAILQKEKIKGSEYFTDAFMSKYISENILDINPKLL